MATTPVTRATLIERVARLANTSGYADPSQGGEISQQVDISLAKIHNFLVGLYQDFYCKTAPITVISGQDTYVLPPDFMKARKLFYSDASGNRWPLRQLNLDDVSATPASTGYTSAPTGYLLLGGNLVVSPRPQNDQIRELILFYIPEYTPAASDQQPIEYAVAFGWDEWVVYDAVVTIRQKAMMPSDDIMAERSRLEQRMTHQAQQRNAGDPRRVTDNGWGGLTPWGKYGSFAIR